MVYLGQGGPSFDPLKLKELSVTAEDPGVVTEAQFQMLW